MSVIFQTHGIVSYMSSGKLVGYPAFSAFPLQCVIFLETHVAVGDEFPIFEPPSLFTRNLFHPDFRMTDFVKFIVAKIVFVFGTVFFSIIKVGVHEIFFSNHTQIALL